MVDFWNLEPEVAGELGGGSVLDTSVHPPKVTKLEYRFTGWLDDDLLETFPCYLITERVAAALSAETFAGYQLATAEIVLSDEFQELYPGRSMPGFRWLKITGEAGIGDFGVSKDHTLVVSDTVLEFLRKFTLEQCDIEEWA
jgi:hypothetical protein